MGSISIVTGNPATRRDFTDVRDVVRASRVLADPSVPVGVYNVCSGVSVSAAETEWLPSIPLRDTIAWWEAELVARDASGGA